MKYTTGVAGCDELSVWVDSDCVLIEVVCRTLADEGVLGRVVLGGNATIWSNLL